MASRPLFTVCPFFSFNWLAPLLCFRQRAMLSPPDRGEKHAHFSPHHLSDVPGPNIKLYKILALNLFQEKYKFKIYK